MFIGFVKFEIKQWFLAYQDQFCAFSLARLPTETARKLCLYHFLKETTLSFVFWFLEPVQCLDKTFFVPYLLPSHVKYYPNFSPFQNGRGKNFVMMTSARLANMVDYSYKRTKLSAWSFIVFFRLSLYFSHGIFKLMTMSNGSLE